MPYNNAANQHSMAGATTPRSSSTQKKGRTIFDGDQDPSLMLYSAMRGGLAVDPSPVMASSIRTSTPLSSGDRRRRRMVVRGGSSTGRNVDGGHMRNRAEYTSMNTSAAHHGTTPPPPVHDSSPNGLLSSSSSRNAPQYYQSENTPSSGSPRPMAMTAGRAGLRAPPQRPVSTYHDDGEEDAVEDEVEEDIGVVTTQHNGDNHSAMMMSSSVARAVEGLYRRLNELELKMSYVQKREDEGRRTVGDRLNTLTEQCKANTELLAQNAQRLVQDIARLEDGVSKAVHEEADKREETKQEVFRNLKEELETFEGKLRERDVAIMDMSERTVSKHSTALEGLQKRNASRLDQIDTRMDEAEKRMQSEVTRVDEILVLMKKSRESREMEVLKLLQDTVEQLQSEIANEREARAQSHRKLEKLLVEAAARKWART